MQRRGDIILLPASFIWIRPCSLKGAIQPEFLPSVSVLKKTEVLRDLMLPCKASIHFFKYVSIKLGRNWSSEWDT